MIIIKDIFVIFCTMSLKGNRIMIKQLNTVSKNIGIQLRKQELMAPPAEPSPYYHITHGKKSLILEIIRR